MRGAEMPHIRIRGDAALPTLIYLPGVHGDWTLLTRFRRAVAGRVRLVEMTYPRWRERTLEAQAESIQDALLAHGVHEGWLLAESFGSQIAWSLLGTRRDGIEWKGLILAGGFVRHPWLWAVRLAVRFNELVPPAAFQLAVRFYCSLSRLRYGADAEALAALDEFRSRRTEEDRAAALHRLRLIASSDFRRAAEATRIPVYSVAGFFDLVVPWWTVRRWLRQHCPGWRGDRLILASDHPVLNTSPKASAAAVLEWVAN